MQGLDPALPIAAVLDETRAALSARGVAVLQAPPGAGKTTQVPLALLPDIAGRILMLEPRRVAARAAAERLAALLGESPGARVGYRMRGESRPGSRIEVITEGILTRMLQSDPELSGIGAVLFDEFHERALQADLGLALTLEAREALRPDLKVLVMSATLDAAPVAALMDDAPVITSQGRAYPVDLRWLDTPLGPGTLTGPGFVRAAAELVRRAVAETEGGVLVFLPGVGEIGRVAAAVAGDLPPDVRLMELHGGLPFARQRTVLEPLPEGRKLVLSTAIAETSVTIPDIRVVVDCGRARRARMDPGNGMTRLVTERVTRAEAEQRRGRAGRVADGVCYRLWTKGEDGALQAFPPAEIETADLVPLALELAVWGADDPTTLPFLTQPNPGNFAAARQVLADLGALDAAGRLTADGKALAALPVHPRLGRMLLAGGADMAPLAALLEARDPLRPGPAAVTADLTLRLEALADPGRFEATRPLKADRPALKQIGAEAARLARLAGKGRGLSRAAALSLAYPDRIALRRPGDEPRFLLSGGSGAVMAADDPLAGQRLLVAADLDGDRQAARIRQALPISEADLRETHAGRIAEVTVCEWSRRHRRVEARRQERLGALVLKDHAWPDAPPDAVVPAILDGVRDLGLGCLNWTPAATGLRGRVEWLRARGASMPDFGDAALLGSLEAWFAPYLADIRRFDAAAAIDLYPILAAQLDPAQDRLLREAAPSHFVAPTGTRAAIDYGDDPPSAEIRLQEVFGLSTHPVLGPDRVPLALVLLSPARRPVQKTSDLPGFWATSYAEVRKEMRGRYPKHPWPEDPLTALPTTRTRKPG